MTIDEVMRSANMPTLYQNVMPTLPSDFARDVFLWAVEQPSPDPCAYKAEQFAREVDRIVSFLAPILSLAAKQHGRDEYDPGIMAFVLGRHANLKYGGNKSPTYAMR